MCSLFLFFFFFSYSPHDFSGLCYFVMCTCILYIYYIFHKWHLHFYMWCVQPNLNGNGNEIRFDLRLRLGNVFGTASPNNITLKHRAHISTWLHIRPNEWDRKKKNVSPHVPTMNFMYIYYSAANSLSPVAAFFLVVCMNFGNFVSNK